MYRSKHHPCCRGTRTGSPFLILGVAPILFCCARSSDAARLRPDSAIGAEDAAAFASSETAYDGAHDAAHGGANGGAFAGASADTRASTLVDATAGLASDAAGQSEPASGSVVDPDLATLLRPDFQKPLDEIASEACGYTFTVTQLQQWLDPNPYVEDVSDRSQVQQVEVRAFDAAGRLLAAELSSSSLLSALRDADDQRVERSFADPVRRLQIDYDDAGRPTLVRIRPIETWSDSFDLSGAVISITHYSDGSKSSRLVATSGSPRAVPTICESLNFDDQGRLREREHGCTDAEVVRALTYDDQGRPVSHRGWKSRHLGCPHHLGELTPDEREPDEWEINWYYDDAMHRVTAVWSEHPPMRWAPNWITDYEDGREEVPQRLVRTFDDAGRLLSVEFDNQNDGQFDERVDYTYDEEGLVAEETDFWLDDIVDVIERHTRTEDTHTVERHNMTAFGDHYFYFRTLWSRVGNEPSGVLEGNWKGTWKRRFDDRNRLVEVTTEEEQASYDPEATSPHSVSSHFTRLARVYGSAGFVERQHYESETPGSWPESESSLRDDDATCALTPMCGSSDIVLPDDMDLLTCRAGHILDDRYDWFWARRFKPPPYDSLPDALVPAADCHGVVALPTIRDIVQY